MKKIVKLFKNFVLLYLSLGISTVGFADSLTISCPDPSQLVKKEGNEWYAIIPATKTLSGNPISAMTLTGQLSAQTQDTNSLSFHTKAGLEFNVLKHTISCIYDTQDPNNYMYGQGVQITLSGETDIFYYFKFSECKATPKKMSCSN